MSRIYVNQRTFFQRRNTGRPRPEKRAPTSARSRPNAGRRPEVGAPASRAALERGQGDDVVARLPQSQRQAPAQGRQDLPADDRLVSEEVQQSVPAQE